MTLAMAVQLLPWGLFAAALVLLTVAGRQADHWYERANRSGDQVNGYMTENTLLRRELAESKNHARYFESLSEWQAEHHRVPTDEERDLLWERIRAKLDGAKLPESYSYYTLNGLIRASGGKLS